MDIEGAICDECGNRVGPAGCCATMRSRWTREERLMNLLRKAQSRLVNQGGDISEITHKINVQIYNLIERELGGDIFLKA